MPESTRIGLFGARMDNTGLGVQTWEFFDHMSPTKTMVIDMTAINKAKGKITQNYPERFPGAEIYTGFPDNKTIDAWLDGLDVVFCCEIPYNYYLFEAARLKGIKTVLQYNYEFLDYLQHAYPKPDVLAAPSVWHIDEVQQLGKKLGIQVVLLEVPINRKRLPYSPKTRIHKFLHIAGQPTHMVRNGTDIVIKAAWEVKEDVQIIIKSQHPISLPTPSNVTIIQSDYENYFEVYEGEDALLLPRKYGGLSLQLNESMSCGMIPIMPNMSPQNTFLYSRCLVNPNHWFKIQTRTTIMCGDIGFRDLALRIDEFARMGEDQVAQLSSWSNDYADHLDWKNYQEKYIGLFESL